MAETDTWYYAQQGSSVGPVSTQQIESLVLSGAITRGTLVWPGAGDWIPAASSPLDRLFDSETPAPSLWTNSAPRFGIPELTAQKSLWFSRLVASNIDLLAGFGLLGLGDWVLGNDRYRQTIWFWVLLGVAYYVVLEAVTGRTLGRLITGTVVVDVSGKPPGFSRAIRRTALRVIESPFPFVAGIAMWTTRHHQRLGDLWAGTYVVRKRDLEAIAHRS